MKVFVQIVLVVLVLAFGVFAAFLLYRMRPQPLTTPPKEIVYPVQVLHAEFTNTARVIETGGTVMPARDVRLQPQVSGVVVYLSEALIPGGIVEQGDLLLQIDDRDYQNTVKQRDADLARAKLALEEELGRKVVASQEWALLGEQLETTAEGRALALREPQLAQAQAVLAAAEAALEQAKINLERTRITAPFNGFVLSETVEVGQVVTPQAVFARLVGTDTYWVKATINHNLLPFIPLPDERGRGGAEVAITADSGGLTNWSGRVMRLLPDMASSGQMARLLVEVKDPLGLQHTKAPVPLLLDAYVTCAIQGQPLEKVIAIPDRGLREGGFVWLMNGENRLDIVPVEVAWREKSQVFIRGALNPKDRIITSSLAAPVPGLKLRLIEATPKRQRLKPA